MDRTILLDIKKLFIERLQEKNGWGKNEVIRLYIDCQNEMICEHMGKEIKIINDTTQK
jgi:hypothetical protein